MYIINMLHRLMAVQSYLSVLVELQAAKHAHIVNNHQGFKLNFVYYFHENYLQNLTEVCLLFVNIFLHIFVIIFANIL